MKPPPGLFPQTLDLSDLTLRAIAAFGVTAGLFPLHSPGLALHFVLPLVITLVKPSSVPLVSASSPKT